VGIEDGGPADGDHLRGRAHGPVPLARRVGSPRRNGASYRSVTAPRPTRESQGVPCTLMARH
jgi:hypothetical protein